jgi:hypothetical protein
MRSVIESGHEQQKRDVAVQPSAIVVLSVEAFPPPRSLSSPRASLPALTQEWSGIIGEAGGQIWERDDGSMLICWSDGELADTIGRAVETTMALKKSTKRAGYRLSAGLAPGVARVFKDTGRPGEGWELAGPFYLARWMMNLSAHRGRPLVTEVGVKAVNKRENKTTLLGRISILGNRYINLYEVS